jgi:hypothetical protein
VRILERLDELYAIGGGGVPTVLTERGRGRAFERVAGWMREAARGRNRRDREPLGRSGMSDIWVGSHLDSVPQEAGSTALGVVAAIEALERAGSGRSSPSGARRSAA